ncbi:MAG: hypothetical protein ACO3PO_06060, partial [Limisphaerales bacterium]
GICQLFLKTSCFLCHKIDFLLVAHLIHNKCCPNFHMDLKIGRDHQKILMILPALFYPLPQQYVVRKKGFKAPSRALLASIFGGSVFHL